MTKIIVLILWAIIGIINLVLRDEINKLDYLMIFIMLMTQLIKNLL
jgi:hypothetical protein